MSLAFALVAGVLAILNPCGFALLPAFLSIYVGAKEEQLPAAPTRAVQGIVVGLAVTVGFLAVFALVGLPVALGAGRISNAFPWVGLVLGVAMAAVAIATLAGRRIPLLPQRGPRVSERRGGITGMLLFGAGYGLASLGCSLPILLIVIGASLTTTGGLATLGVLGAYAVGMAAVLMALSIAAALVRDGISRALSRVIPHMRWLTGGLLLVVSLYLVYYWSMTLFASATAQRNDPVLTVVQRFTSSIQDWVNSGGGRWLLIAAAAVIVAALLVAVWQWVFRSESDRAADKTDLPRPAAACDCEQAARSATPEAERS
jgi:cytochrome c biogenesis protein CcdA